MCGRIRRTPYDGLPDGEERDMVRMRGWGLRLMHEDDAAEEIEAIEAELEAIDWNDRENTEAIAVLIDAVEGLAKGEYRARVPDYDPADDRAVKVGHENPIRWVRKTEARMKETKRRRRIAC
jgi:hypothetical protein